MMDVRCDVSGKVVQTTLTETEYALLAAYAEKHKMTIKEATRAAIRGLTMKDEVRPDDPLFTIFPLVKKGRHTDGSERHDHYLYG